ncbi:hypothetical protein DPMN_151484 [Dreissena polymorpha]|uniref:Uncharacterized protein n=1 Tax=Dreissena polymorpha TaxID=45954 RepID=A0A9D4FHQ8_DREPO|nr:hypothetical protein DPMN_151484 [Dreissena polymorpha]
MSVDAQKDRRTDGPYVRWTKSCMDSLVNWGPPRKFGGLRINRQDGGPLCRRAKLGTDRVTNGWTDKH